MTENDHDPRLWALRRVTQRLRAAVVLVSAEVVLLGALIVASVASRTWISFAIACVCMAVALTVLSGSRRRLWEHQRMVREIVRMLKVDDERRARLTNGRGRA